ncbi:DUF1573 domain-containing protein [Mesoterricola sediminis]|uniref:DUF1573 domain-containing protein n=1 Tax=Mesoterricola sediminis TaxID=2927980 RepID=A0AA48GT87_9BACT|nr:DUF1573 domain-containing protein [Mesoterricola sediminis]BDU78851.1 hypothetical protein METESE_38090 [Mesoterricola sediminis]
MRSPLLLLTVPALCWAQGPVISVDRPHHDFGRIDGDSRVTHRFRISNRGGANLNISRLNPSCGCTSTVIGQWTLKPGESTEVEAAFNPAGFRGTVRKSIQVVSDDPANPNLTLTFEAEIVREITPSQDSVFFQGVRRTGTTKHAVKLTSGTGRPVRVTRIDAPGAKYLSFGIRPEGGNVWVDIALDGAALPAHQMVGTDAVAIQTDNPRAPLLNVTVQWEAYQALTATPPRVAIAEAPGREHRQKILVANADRKPFRILSARATSSLLRVEGLGGGASDRHELTIVMDARAKAGLYNERITLTTDSPDQREFELRVAASLR